MAEEDTIDERNFARDLVAVTIESIVCLFVFAVSLILIIKLQQKQSHGQSTILPFFKIIGIAMAIIYSILLSMILINDILWSFRTKIAESLNSQLVGMVIIQYMTNACLILILYLARLYYVFEKTARMYSRRVFIGLLLFLFIAFVSGIIAITSYAWYFGVNGIISGLFFSIALLMFVTASTWEVILFIGAISKVNSY